ncbi:unnamed protein product [Dovyalis caffra]|uniref:Glutamyl/glutaminyl-tRNA synthetase class Ib catalytic domain-containing protein n=1 Tax=Dovyalis caffra TaxID=77055 RepID=A0AAV1RUQ8_9ROSI|nr:unnamed protein product [Dovyalis caffra]
MLDPNKSLRDPVYCRCNPIPHRRIGSKYKIHPTYDFACPLVDSVQANRRVTSPRLWRWPPLSTYKIRWAINASLFLVE